MSEASNLPCPQLDPEYGVDPFFFQQNASRSGDFDSSKGGLVPMEKLSPYLAAHPQWWRDGH